MKFLVLAGTLDGRDLAKELELRGHQTIISALTEYGAELAEETGLSTRYGALDKVSLRNLLLSHSFTAVVDATHPYAEKVHKLAKTVCQADKIPYFRWIRTPSQTENHPLIKWANNIPEAACQAGALGKRILLTTGSNSLAEWLRHPTLQEKELFVRVLPTSTVLNKCEKLGLKPYQIIAAQGPFSQEWNEAVCVQLKIDVVVAKDSGQVGGTPEKVAACLNLGLPIILLKRPEQEEDSLTYSEFIMKMEEELCKQK